MKVSGFTSVVAALALSIGSQAIQAQQPEVSPSTPLESVVPSLVKTSAEYNLFNSHASTCDSCGSTGACCDTGCLSGGGFSLQDMLCGDDSFAAIYGWTQLGYHSESTGLFNTHPDGLRLHQQWLGMKREADGSCGVDYGFGVDLLYGYDAADTQAFGGEAGSWDTQWNHGSTGWALPQVYGEIAAGDWSVRAGHFYTLVGYEVVQAPDNFFYSHAFTQYTIEPFTHTGAYATYSGIGNVTVYGGWTAGWDTGFNQFDSFPESDGSNFLGGISLELTEAMTLTYITTFGDFGQAAGVPFASDGTAMFAGVPVAAGLTASPADGYEHSLVLSYDASDDLTFVLQSDYLGLYDINFRDAMGTSVATGQREAFSLNGYAFYTINDTLAFGQRLEWLHLRDEARMNGMYLSSLSSNQEFYEYTAGLNIKLHENVMLRPEYRYQWATNEVNPFIGGNMNASSFGMDMVLTY